MSGENHPTIESLKIRNFNLQLEINGLHKRIGNSHEEDWELVNLRERVMKLTKENQRLEFMMQTMTERFSNQNDFGKLELKENETQVNILEDNAQVFTNPNASSNSDDAKEFVKVKAVTSIGQEELREKLLKSKLESDKTLKHLIEIKETLKTSEYDQRKFHKLDRMVDSAIDSAHIVNTNTGLILNTSKEDIEALERDIDAIKTSNDTLEHECLALVNDRSTLESLLTDLRGNIAGLVEKVEKKSSPKNRAFLKASQQILKQRKALRNTQQEYIALTGLHNLHFLLNSTPTGVKEYEILTSTQTSLSSTPKRLRPI
ncbi:uncharacterized protein LOC124444695 [Xenia sp. Carnegie-2017]|uniref:uncharacterized protein LOC124444695 n=1 Tax=Xenia sp. Carnegie-2017 TaxID=2897299 RepID=UPI001F04D313|nr:uncharacterized protein LOC124444695 [Xenia sp. Carnegie-2017]